MQYSLYRLRRRLAGTRLVIDLQHQGVDILSTRVVAPVYTTGERAAFPVLHPRFEWDGDQYEIHMESLAVIDGRFLIDPVTDLTHLDYEISKAFDRLFSGI